MTYQIPKCYRVVALVVLIGLLLPIVLVVIPQRTHAQFGGPVTVIGGIGTIQETLSSASNAITANSTLLTQIKGYILDPLAHALAQAILQSITASVVNWINGNNGSGQPLFVQNLAGHLQSLGDTVTLSFISQFQQSINSPFAGVIASSLQQNYLQGSSLAGFFAANQCTLSQVSPNINAFVGGNFSQGGWASWFALTTQPQNDPYMLYELAQSQAASLRNTATANRTQELTQNNGFLSWCGNSSGGGGGASAGAKCTSDDDCAGSLACLPEGSPNATCQVDPSVPSPPGSCTNKDGTTGTIQTPGSVIHDSLTKTLGSGVDSLVNTHDFDQMVDAILAALITNVVSDTGLLGTSQSQAGAAPFTTQLNTSNPLSAQSTTGGTVGSSINSQSLTQVQTQITNIQSYQSSWVTIGNAANAAQTSLNNLISCYQSSGVPDSAGAGTALTNVVDPVIAQAVAAAQTSTTALAAAQNVQSEAENATTLDQTTQAATDMSAVISSPPTPSDVSLAQSNSQVTGAATSSPPGSVNVGGGTTVDQMNLISQNAQAALTTCQTPPYMRGP